MSETKEMIKNSCDQLVYVIENIEEGQAGANEIAEVTERLDAISFYVNRYLLFSKQNEVIK